MWKVARNAKILTSLRLRLLLLILVAALPAFGLSVVRTRVERDREIAAARARVVAIAQQATSMEARLLDDSRRLLATLAEVDEVRRAAPERCHRFLSRLLPLYRGTFLNLGLADRQGNVICSALPFSHPVNIADHRYFQEALRSGKPAIGTFQIGRITKAPSVNLGYPLADATGKGGELLFAALDLRFLARLAQGVHLPPEMVLTVTDRQGTVIARIPDAPALLGTKAGKIAAATAAGPSADEVFQVTAPDGGQWLYAASPWPSALYRDTLRVLLAVPAKSVFGVVNARFQREIVILVMVMVSCLGAAIILLDRGLMRQIRQLIVTARKLAAGETAARALAAPHASSEVRRLTVAFNRMADALQHHQEELLAAYDATLEGWVYALDLRDRETEGHSQRVTAMTVRLARVLGMSEAEITHIRRGALLHDIGKIGIPDAILHKSGPLSEEEWRIMRQHPVHAYNMLSRIAYLRPAVAIPYCHHEKWDGRHGYPRGLRGEQIPLAARLFAIVDVWDALGSDRPYRKAWPEEEVLRYLRSQAGKQFDPQLVELFIDMVDRSEGDEAAAA